MQYKHYSVYITSALGAYYVLSKILHNKLKCHCADQQYNVLRYQMQIVLLNVCFTAVIETPVCIRLWHAVN